MSALDGNALPKRFYKSVEMTTDAGGYAVTLDSKPVRTPARGTLSVAHEALAREIVIEWERQGKKIDPATMPMTKRANTALDSVCGREGEIAEDIIEYAGTDLLCYRAEIPEELVVLQASHWDPVLDWIKDELDAGFAVQTGIAHIAQSERSLSKVGEAVTALDFYTLTPFHTITTLTGSALLALALVRGHLDPDAVWNAAHVDEDWQISQWGEDAQAKARRLERRAEFDADVRFLNLTKP